LPEIGQLVGMDVGLKTFATRSTGQEMATPRCFRAEENPLAKVPRRLSTEEEGTPERARRRRMVARVQERMAWRRSDFTHQHSRRIINAVDLIAVDLIAVDLIAVDLIAVDLIAVDLIAVEDLAVTRMTQNQCRATSMQDAAWSQFTDLLSYQAAWASRRYSP
jgi:putative transposase